MPRPRDLLQRFRFAGAPGAAAGGGVPADRAAELAAELEPVLRLLDPVQDEARRIRADGDATADRVRRAAADDARRRVAAAQEAAATLRTQAAAALVRRAAEEHASVQDAADRRAQAVRQRASSRMPAYVDRVVAEVLASFAEGGP